MSTCRKPSRKPPGSRSLNSGRPGSACAAIGRSLRITAPAIYNYFPDRDALVTALMVDAFTSFGKALEAARDVLPKEDYASRFNAVGFAYRRWAIAHPQHFLLIFGNLVPGYEFSDDRLGPAPLNSFLVLVGVLDEAQQAGAIHLPEGYVQWTPALKAQVQVLSNVKIPCEPLGDLPRHRSLVQGARTDRPGIERFPAIFPRPEPGRFLALGVRGIFPSAVWQIKRSSFHESHHFQRFFQIRSDRRKASGMH